MSERTITVHNARKRFEDKTVNNAIIWFHNHGEFSYFSASIDIVSTQTRLYLCDYKDHHTRQQFDTMAEAYRALRDVGFREGSFKEWVWKRSPFNDHFTRDQQEPQHDDTPPHAN
jgi:hypothetical protein